MPFRSVYRQVSSTLIFVLVGMAGMTSAETMAPTIVHEPIKQALQGQPIRIEAVVADDIGVERITLFCRTAGTEVYWKIPMRVSLDTVSEQIPPEFVTSAGVEYYIVAEDVEGNRTTSPTVDALRMPYEVRVVSGASFGSALRFAQGQAQDESFPHVLVLNPEPNAQVEAGDQVIAVSFFDVEGDIDLNSIRFTVDGRDVTRNAQVSRTLVTYMPERPFAQGAHRVSVEVSDRAGHRAGPVSWQFTVSGAKPRPLKLSGDFVAGLKYDKPSRTRANVPLWDNQIRMRTRGTLGGFHLNGLLYLTSYETRFLTSEKLDKRQPLNRYTLNARSRWLDLTVGDSNPVLSDLTLKGVLIRGIAAKAKLGPMRLTFVRGATKRAIAPEIERRQPALWLDGTTYVAEGDTIALTPADRVADDSTAVLRQGKQGTFKRNITAAQLLFDVKERFEIGLNLMQAEDDTNSIATPPLFRELYRPKTNYAVSLRTALKLNRRRTVLSAEIGETIITQNVFSELADTTLTEDIPEWVKDFIKLNASTQTTLDISEPEANVTPRLYRFAFATPLYFTHWRAEYYRVPPGYASLGNPQQQTDVHGYRLNTRVRLLSNQLTATVGYEARDDNVDESKLFTTTTSTISTHFSLTPNALPQYSPTLSIGYRAYGRENDSVDEPTKVTNETSTLSIGMGGKLQIAGIRNSVNVNVMRMSYRDNNILTKQRAPGFDSNSFILGLRSDLAIPLNLSATFGVTSNEDKADGVTTKVRIVQARGRYALFGERLNLYSRLSRIGSSNDLGVGYGGAKRPIDSSRFSFAVGSGYRLSGNQSLRGEVKYIRFTDHEDSTRDYREPIFEVSYRRSL